MQEQALLKTEQQQSRIAQSHPYRKIWRAKECRDFLPVQECHGVASLCTMSPEPPPAPS